MVISMESTHVWSSKGDLKVCSTPCQGQGQLPLDIWISGPSYQISFLPRRQSEREESGGVLPRENIQGETPDNSSWRQENQFSAAQGAGAAGSADGDVDGAQGGAED